MLSSLLLVFLNFSVQAADLECAPGKIKSLQFGKTKITSANLCTNSKRDVLQSQNCAQRKCAALRPTANVEVPVAHQNGKPGFKLCWALSGVPEIIEFEFKGKWFKLDRCVFPQDSSFVDTATLLTQLK